MQKNKFWKFSYIFSTGPSLSKFYYITHLCEIELTRKFHFFQIFHFKTMHLFPKSRFYIKNWFFWGTLCWYSSNSKRMGGGQFLQILPHRPRSHSLITVKPLIRVDFLFFLFGFCIDSHCRSTLITGRLLIQVLR